MPDIRFETEALKREKRDSYWAGVLSPVIIPAVIIILTAPALFVRGLAVKLIWGWYICQTFGVAPLTLMHAVGLSLLLIVIIPSGKRGGDRDKSENPFSLWGRDMLALVISCSMFVFLAWVGTWFL